MRRRKRRYSHWDGGVDKEGEVHAWLSRRSHPPSSIHGACVLGGRRYVGSCREVMRNGRQEAIG